MDAKPFMRHIAIAANQCRKCGDALAANVLDDVWNNLHGGGRLLTPSEAAEYDALRAAPPVPATADNVDALGLTVLRAALGLPASADIADIVAATMRLRQAARR